MSEWWLEVKSNNVDTSNKLVSFVVLSYYGKIEIQILLEESLVLQIILLASVSYLQKREL